MTSPKWNGLSRVMLEAVARLPGSPAVAQPMPKAQVANLIRKVENGVDPFRDYLKKRGDNARMAATAPQNQARRAWRAPASESTTAEAESKDDLDDALSDLNRSTNPLRRKFDATDTWMETKAEVDAVMDDARRINQVVARGNSRADASRIWAALQLGIKELASSCGLPPMAA